MRSTQSVKTLTITSYTSYSGIVVDIYIGDTSSSGDFTNDNTKCHTGSMNGVIACDGSGRYLIILRESSETDSMKVAEIAAYSYENLAPSGIVTDLVNLTDSDNSIQQTFG